MMVSEIDVILCADNTVFTPSDVSSKDPPALGLPAGGLQRSRMANSVSRPEMQKRTR